LPYYMGYRPHRREGHVRCGRLPSPSVIQNSRPRAPTRRPERASAGGRLRPPSVVLRGRARRVCARRPDPGRKQ
jgi:hypothetical protein